MPCLRDAEGAKVRKLLSSVKGTDLFCDPEFPATNNSLHHESVKEGIDVVWKRPHELVAKPQLFVDGVNRCDVAQGGLGDCWFLSACSSVATRPELIKQVIPDDQVLYGEGYKGLVTFRFWRMSTWVAVNIDDRLPVDEDNDLLYSKCRDPNEFWLPLLEKAFAKFHGNYNNLDGGQLAEGFTGLTGYISESMGLEGLMVHKEPLFKLLRDEFRNGSLITCSRGDIETAGLVTNHAYTLTGARRIELPNEGVAKLVRVRNPWGQTEWEGDWADSDPRWKKLADSVKKEMEYHPDDDGEFWIRMTDFLTQFDGINIATKIPDIDNDEAVQFKSLYEIHGGWQKGRSAGGSQEDIKKYATNPQYLLTVKQPDDGDDCQPGEAEDDEPVCKAIQTCRVIIELVQEHNRKKFKNFYPIGFSVFPYKKSKPPKRLTCGDLSDFPKLEGSTEYEPTTSVVARLNLEPGSYVIVPSTDEPDLSREYLLRVYCRKPITLKEIC